MRNGSFLIAWYLYFHLRKRVEPNSKQLAAKPAAYCVRAYLAYSNRGCGVDGGFRIKSPLKLTHSLARSLYSAMASHAAPKAFFSPSPLLSPLFQCIHADLYGLYPPLPSSFSPPLPSLLPLSFTPSISDQVLGLESDPYPGIFFHF